MLSLSGSILQVVPHSLIMITSKELSDNLRDLPLVEGLTTFFLIFFVLVTGLRLYARIFLLESGFRIDDC